MVSGQIIWTTDGKETWVPEYCTDCFMDISGAHEVDGEAVTYHLVDGEAVTYHLVDGDYCRLL